MAAIRSFLSALRSPKRRRSASTLVMLLAFAGCSRPFSAPMPPNLDPFVLLFEAPTAAFADLDTEDTVRKAFNQKRDLDALGELETITSLVDEMDGAISDQSEGDEEEDRGIAIGGIPAGTEALLEASGPCATTASLGSVSRTGTVVLRAVVENSALIPSVWGEVQDCKLRDADSAYEVSGEVALRVQNLGQASASRDWVLRYDFSEVRATSSTPGPLEGTVRIRDQRLDFILFVSEDEHLIATIPPDASRVTFRATDGRWVCHPEARSCTPNDEALEALTY